MDILSDIHADIHLHMRNTPRMRQAHVTYSDIVDCSLSWSSASGSPAMMTSPFSMT